MTSYYYDNQIPVYRNVNNTTSMTLDSTNNQLIIENTTIPKKIIINSEEFSNGTQVLPFTQIYTKVNACEATVYPPTASNILTINDTLVANNGTGSIATLGVSSLTLDGSGIGGPTNTITQGDMTIQDNTATNTGQITADYAQFSAPSYTSILNASSLDVSDVANSYTSNVSAGIITLTDGNGGSPLRLELDTDHTIYPDPQIRFQDSTGLNSYLRFKELNADGHYCYNFTNNEKFFKQNNPFSFRQVELLNGDYIEKDYPFVMIQNGGGATLKLRDPTEYLDDNGNAGWSCIVSNYDGVSLSIDIASASSWYAHSNGGGQANPIDITKWTTCRITLVYSSIDSQYVWAVSQF